MIDSYYYGHHCYWDEDELKWRYVDTGEDMHTVAPRPCPKCGVPPTAKGHDACIADLPGVRFACCGHGVREGYVAFENGCRLGGEFEVSYHALDTGRRTDPPHQKGNHAGQTQPMVDRRQ